MMEIFTGTTGTTINRGHFSNIGRDQFNYYMTQNTIIKVWGKRKKFGRNLPELSGVCICEILYAQPQESNNNVHTKKTKNYVKLNWGLKLTKSGHSYTQLKYELKAGKSSGSIFLHSMLLSDGQKGRLLNKLSTRPKSKLILYKAVSILGAMQCQISIDLNARLIFSPTEHLMEEKNQSRIQVNWNPAFHSIQIKHWFLPNQLSYQNNR